MASMTTPTPCNWLSTSPRDNMLVCWFPAGDYLVTRTLLGFHLFEIFGNGTLHAAHNNHICPGWPERGATGSHRSLRKAHFPSRIAGQRRFVLFTSFLKMMRELGSSRQLSYQSGPLGENDSASFFCPAIRHLDIVVRPNNAGASGPVFRGC